MKVGTRHLLLKLIDEKIESYQKAIYSLNITQVKNYEDIIRKHQKKVKDLMSAKDDIKEKPVEKTTT